MSMKKQSSEELLVLRFCVSILLSATNILKTLRGVGSGGFRVEGVRGKTKKGGPLMSSSYSSNRDKHF